MALELAVRHAQVAHPDDGHELREWELLVGDLVVARVAVEPDVLDVDAVRDLFHNVALGPTTTDELGPDAVSGSPIPESLQ